MIKKIFIMEVDGKKIGFRFNMLCHGKACEFEKCSMGELWKRLGLTQEQETNIVTLTNFFRAAAINYNEGEGDFENVPTAQDVSDWLDSIGYIKSIEMMTEHFKTPKIKNQEAPTQEAGQ